MNCPELETQMGDMPDQFEDVETALTHLQILVNQFLDLHQAAETHHETHPWVPSQISPVLQPKFEEISSKYKMWTKALSHLEGAVQTGDQRQRAGLLLLKIFQLSFDIDLHVFVDGESTYDNFKETNLLILSLIEAFLQMQSDATDQQTSSHDQARTSPSSQKNSYFTSSPEIVPVLFEIATRSSDGALRQKACHLLRSRRRREGIWDSHVAASLAEQIAYLKEQGTTVAAESQDGARKFLLTDIILLSERQCMVRYGFKRVQPGTFGSFWLETINPGEGLLQSQVLTIS